MIHIRRDFNTLQVEIELRGISHIPRERFCFPMELLGVNEDLNEAYISFRGRAHGRDTDALRMPITPANQLAMRLLQQVLEVAIREQASREQACRAQERWNWGSARAIMEGSVLA